MVEVAVGIRMVAAQLLLMNHFLMSLSHNTADLSSFHDINSVAVDPGECSYGCTQCSPINGCLACKPPFFLSLHREGVRQVATCTRSCPKGFYKLKKKRNGFCAKCTMRGCTECLDSRYCSTCDASFVNFFGKCIKHKSDEAREDLGMYTTTRRPVGEYLPPSGSWSPTKNNVTFLFSQLPHEVNSSGDSEASLATPPSTPTETTTPVADVGTTTEFIRRRSKPSSSPDLGTRFYFTTPSSPLLSVDSTSSIYPYHKQSAVAPPEAPCRAKRPRGSRKERKGRRGRKKKDRDRKLGRRRKGRKGHKNGRYGCKRRRGKDKKENSRPPPPPPPPSQDPYVRQLNSVSQGGRRPDDPFHDAKASLFEDTNSSVLSFAGWAKDLPHRFRNRPRDMVAYKKSLVAQRKNGDGKKARTLYNNKNDLRLRHGRSRQILSNGQIAEGYSRGKRRPQTRSARRRKGRNNRRRRRKQRRNLEELRDFASSSTL